MEKIRIQKYFTDCALMSRRAAEKEILAGKVKVNGKVATIGMTIDPEGDVVEYKGKIVEAPRGAGTVCVMLNKPRGYITTMSDDRGRHTVAELVDDVGVRVYPIGRLDMDSDGLLLLTNNGELANKLTHPRHGIQKTYRVKVRGVLSAQKLAALNAPMLIDGYQTLPARVSVLETSGNNTVLSVVLSEGRNRQIRKMCESQELTVLRLTRTAIGNLTLSSLPRGKWRPLTPHEIRYLTDNSNSSKSNAPTENKPSRGKEINNHA
ncbi:MAG: pseudouridine synthase [Eubacteriales bacterium]